MQSSKLAAASKPLAAAVRASARRGFLAGPAYNAAKKLMPKISETERVALGSRPARKLLADEATGYLLGARRGEAGRRRPHPARAEGRPRRAG